MTDTSGFLEDVWELFSWRILSNYVSPWELSQIKAEIEEWDQWCGVWSSWARRHLDRGDAAAAAGHDRTAATAYVTAGLFYHWASFLFTHDSGQFRSALEAAEDAFARAAPLVEHPMQIINLPFEGTKLRGYLRLPRGATSPSPLVVLIPGADSSKEELYDLGDHILRRGIAAYCFDGPGHGLVSFDLKLRREYEGPLCAIVDHLVAREDIDGSRLALGGISYGGMSAIRGAVFDDRVRAVVSVSSWYSAAGRFQRQREVSRIALRQYLGPDPAAVQDTMTLDGVAERLTVPLLQVYGGLDAASPQEQAQRVAAAVKGPNVLKVFDQGVHVCNNLWYEARPFIADWLGDTLNGRP
jgi:2,6-dihydroxypseudooxynicotine hydrolase